MKRCIWNAQWRSPIPQYHCLFACWHLMGTQLPSTLLPGSLGQQVATTLIRFWLIVVCCQKTANCWLFKMFLSWSITTTGSSGFIWPFSFGFCICQNLLLYLVKGNSGYSLTASSSQKGACEETTSPRPHWCQPLCSSWTWLLVTPCQHPAASHSDPSPCHHHPSFHKPASHNYQSKQWMHGWRGAQTACC